jgi:hypothetical protein
VRADRAGLGSPEKPASEIQQALTICAGDFRGNHDYGIVLKRLFVEDAKISRVGHVRIDTYKHDVESVLPITQRLEKEDFQVGLNMLLLRPTLNGTCRLWMASEEGVFETTKHN